MHCNKLITFLLFCLYCNFIVSAQNQHHTDSLIIALSNAKDDTTRINILNLLADHQNIGNKGTMNYAQKALILSEKINYKIGIVSALYNISTLYRAQYNLVKALEYEQKCLKYRQSWGDSDGIANSFNNISVLYTSIGDYAKAIEMINQSLLNIDTAKNKKVSAFLLNNISLEYQNMKEYVKALEYAQKSLHISEEIKDTFSIAQAYLDIGDIYEHEDSLPVAIEYVKKSLFMNRSIESIDNVANSYEHLGNAYLLQGNMSASITSYRNARDIYKHSGNELSLSYVLGDIASNYFQQKKYITAKKYYIICLQLAKKLDLKDEIITSSKYLSSCDSALGKYKEAYEMQKLFKQYSDSVFNNENTKKIFRLEMQYDYDKQTDSIKVAENLKDEKSKQQQGLSKLQLQQQWFYSIGILILIGLASSWLIYNNRIKRQKLKTELAKEKAEQEKKEAQFQRSLADISLTALRSQMNPHFIFNCLNSIKLYTTQNDTIAATEYLSKFSKLIRLVMENSRNDRITLQSELEALRLYIEMEVMRFKEKLAYSIKVDNDVETDYIEIPPLLLQPYVENAIWHGLMHKEEGGRIDINVSCKRMNHCLK